MSIVGGGIVVVGVVSGAPVQACLPWVRSMVANPERPTSERMNLVGGMIRQSAAKDVSSAVMTYSGLVDADEADALDTIDKGTSTGFLGNGRNVWAVEIDAKVWPSSSAGLKQVEATFKIIREVC